MGPVALGFLASLAAGLVTSFSALPILFGGMVSRRLNDALLRLRGRGHASCLVLLSYHARSRRGTLALRVCRHGCCGWVAGVVLGALSIAAINELVPHEHFVQGRQGPAAGSLDRSRLFVLAITIHNLPEGLAVGAYAVSLSQSLLPWGMTFAAGAMIYVISHEIIPETHQHGFQNEATAGLTAGLALMMFLDVAFGSS